MDDERMDGRKDERTDNGTNARTDGKRDERTVDGRTVRTYLTFTGTMDGRTGERWTDGQRDERTDGHWTDGQSGRT